MQTLPAMPPDNDTDSLLLPAWLRTCRSCSMANGGCAAVRRNKLVAQQKAQTVWAVGGDMWVASIAPLQMGYTVLDPNCLLADRQ